MCYDTLEHTISNLEGQIASLSENNKKLEEELAYTRKVVESQKNVFKKVEKILEEKAMGFNGVFKMYAKDVMKAINKMLEKEGVVDNG